MADFAVWASACEPALWPVGTFCSAYRGNRDEAVHDVIDADPIAAAVRAMMSARPEWTGTASVLLAELAVIAGERITKAKSWPESPRALGGRLRRAATVLRKVGIDVAFGREGRARTRMIHIAMQVQTTENGLAQPSASSSPSAPTPTSNAVKAFAVAERPMNSIDADGSGHPSVSCNP
jgi:hypothetical protein